MLCFSHQFIFLIFGNLLVFNYDLIVFNSINTLQTIFEVGKKRFLLILFNQAQ